MSEPDSLESIALHNTNIIVNLIRPYLNKSALTLINEYWFNVMNLIMSRHGSRSIVWRESVRRLNDLITLLNPLLKASNPKVAIRLIPSLVSEMKAVIIKEGFANNKLDTVIKGVLFGAPAI